MDYREPHQQPTAKIMVGPTSFPSMLAPATAQFPESSKRRRESGPESTHQMATLRWALSPTTPRLLPPSLPQEAPRTPLAPARSRWTPLDIAAKVMLFCEQGPRTVCILSATGPIRNVTVRQSQLRHNI
ncbi:unnamed protein product [Sphenostylis stenocarpa]|uniref:AT-hook motif nuclear-localized protein n=1 Tax=Sphenostylis stenocarpa TaxID=92480 RepID=A0AA86S0D0_9FABA|nr:unnamed protein product [Sphenostylis stenocarpa]